MGTRYCLLITLLAVTACQKSAFAQRAVRGSSGGGASSALGCIAYRQDGTCRKCEEPAYQLQRGSCICATGYTGSTDGSCRPGPCYNKCGQTYIQTADGYCHCDYYCDNHNDCCGGAASKNALCPSMRPSKNKNYLTNCQGTVNRQSGEPSTRRIASASTYLPGMCWCDAYCTEAGDCCPRCNTCRANQAPAAPAPNAGRNRNPDRGSNRHSSSTGSSSRGSSSRGSSSSRRGSVSPKSMVGGRQGLHNAVSVASLAPSSILPAMPGSAPAPIRSVDGAATPPGVIGSAPAPKRRDNGKSKVAVAADSSSTLGIAVAAVAAAAVSAKKIHVEDCGAHEPYPLTLLGGSTGSGTVSIAAVPQSQLEAENQMQACQAADQGAPDTPIVLPLYWTAGRVCRGTSCTGGSYTAELVQEQVDYVNNLYAHVGIQFEWDGEIHQAEASSPMDIDVCLDPSGNCWACRQRRYGDQAAINVITSPTHVGGTSLGVTLYPSYTATRMMPSCANWVFIYERTLPGLGGVSLVDGGLADSGATLAHEIGHQLMLHHTWYEERSYPRPSIKQQCEYSASMSPIDVVAGRSDGVRDTPAQSLNSTVSGGTDILRFIGCDPDTGAYRNTTAFAQQSCTSATGFKSGDDYYNNFGNLMSYGDKSCLRTLTPGQGARARCAIKCMRQMEC